MTDINAPIDYPTKRKTHDRLHPVIFLMGWIAIITFGWYVLIAGQWEVGAFLPESVQRAIRNAISYDIRSYIRTLVFSCMIIGITITHWYWLNRSFGLRLSRWFVVATIGGRIAIVGIVYIFIWLPLPDFSRLTYIIIWAFVGELPLALGQWWILRRRWQFAWLWIVAAIVSGFAIQLLMEVYVFGEAILFDTLSGAKQWIPIGIAHGLITGLAALTMDNLTRRAERPELAKAE